MWGGLPGLHGDACDTNFARYGRSGMVLPNTIPTFYSGLFYIEEC